MGSPSYVVAAKGLLVIQDLSIRQFFAPFLHYKSAPLALGLGELGLQPTRQVHAQAIQ